MRHGRFFYWSQCSGRCAISRPLAHGVEMGRGPPPGVLWPSPGALSVTYCLVSWLSRCFVSLFVLSKCHPMGLHYVVTFFKFGEIGARCDGCIGVNLIDLLCKQCHRLKPELWNVVPGFPGFPWVLHWF